MLTNQCTGSGEGIILTDKANRVGITPLCNESHITGNFNPGGTLGNTGYALLALYGALTLLNVRNIILTEALKTAQNQPGGTMSDGAVSGSINSRSGFLDKLQRFHRGSAGENVLQQIAKLTEANAAGYALTAGLGMAKAQERSSHVYGAENCRTGRHSAQNGCIKIIKDSLRLGLGGNIKSAQLLTTSL